MDVMAKRIREALLIAVIFSIPLGEIVRFQFGQAAVTATDITVVLFIAASVLRIKFTKARLTKPLLIFSSIAAVSLLVNLVNLKPDELLISALYLLRWIAYAGVYISIINLDSSFKKKIPAMITAMGAVVVGIGLLQYFLYPNLRNLYYLGWDEHLYRLFSSFLDPNFAGAFLVLYLIFVLGIFIRNKSSVYGLISVVTLVSTILTFSRSAYLMLFVGLLVSLFLYGKKKLILGFIGLFLVSIVIVSVAGRGNEGTNLLRITSTQARFPSAQNALTIFSKNPILGVGFNAYEFATIKYGLSKTSKFPNHSAAGTDNSFLFVLATMGVVGLISYLYLWFRVLSVSRKSKYSAVLTASVIALFVDSLFINSLFYIFIMLWMWILLGLSED